MQKKKYIEGAEPLYLHGDDRGLLLLHGAGGGTTWDMKGFAHAAHQLGYSIWVPSLPGFGTTPSDLHNIILDDWLNEAREGVKHLHNNCTTVTVVGFSVGGVIALLLAAEGQNISRLATWAAPWRIKNRKLYLLPFWNKLPLVRRFIPQQIPVAISAHKRKMGWIGYDWLPVPLGFIILAALKRLHNSVNKVTCPVFIIQGTNDEAIVNNSAQSIYNKISSTEKEIWSIPGGTHSLMLDPFKEMLFQRTLEYIGS